MITLFLILVSTPALLTFSAKSTATNKNSLYGETLCPRHPLGQRQDRGSGHSSFCDKWLFHRCKHDGWSPRMSHRRVHEYLHLQPSRQSAYSRALSRQEGGKIFRIRLPDTCCDFPPSPQSSQGRNLRTLLPRHRRLPSAGRRSWRLCQSFRASWGLHRKNAWQRLKPNKKHDWINLWHRIQPLNYSSRLTSRIIEDGLLS